MHPLNIPGTGLLLLSMTLIFCAPVSAQIYKWVDADGKVHFGDKPRDPNATSDAQQVELGNSYQPSARTVEEQEAYDAEQRNMILRSQVYRREQEEAHEKAMATRREEHAKLCASYADAIKELSTVEVKNGVRSLVYIKDEEGKPVSSERQRQIIEELKVKKAEAGCS
jgi:Domain of unknown function (DUF4124)